MKSVIDFFYIVLGALAFAAAVVCALALFAGQTDYISTVKNQGSETNVYSETNLNYDDTEMTVISKEELISWLQVSPDKNVTINSNPYLIKIFSGRGIDNRVVIRDKSITGPGSEKQQTYLNFGKNRWRADKLEYQTTDGTSVSLDTMLSAESYQVQEIIDDEGNFLRLYITKN